MFLKNVSYVTSIRSISIIPTFILFQVYPFRDEN